MPARDPFELIAAEIARMGQFGSLGPSDQGATPYDEAGIGLGGIIADDGTIKEFGKLDVTPLDVGDGFVLR